MNAERRSGQRRHGERRKKVRNGLDHRKFDRRHILKISALTTIAGIFPCPLFGAVDKISAPCKKISLYNLHTDESLEVTYCADGEYIPEALHQIDNILRDHRSGEIKPIDTGLLDLLHTICRIAKADSPIHIISGYRSAATNAKLHKSTTGVAGNSLHIHGKAADIRLPGCELKFLRQIAVKLRAGGVGYYAKSDFIHVDTGRVRYW